ncbi:hypothetical protein ENUP19_0042G0016 [Entamoeba nuttalli]|uniref:small monomeric GTPase n=2 Tax=Entamoeba nuttalli TaxID=412467 RepID=K2H984_ENTNP|nr:Ras family GTPase [Entamoeba nuttalli P19]EKE39129.1 Ras family GTPase [Entamoeba nuttalli P19]|eukprot:XP_008858534.1 Ras family GTPase [Entamoeba nuttalli P19]
MSLKRIVMLGTGAVGKSAITLQYVSHYFASDYNPTIEDSFRTSITIGDDSYPIEILDTAGQEEFDALKDTYIRSGDGFAIVYSITSLNTFLEANEIRERIYRVLDKDVTQHIPICLVGNKSDLENERIVSKEQAEELACLWGISFIETSAKKKSNINELYQIIMKDIIDTKTKEDEEKKKLKEHESITKKSSKKQKDGKKFYKKIGCSVM